MEHRNKANPDVSPDSHWQNGLRKKLHLCYKKTVQNVVISEWN